MNKKITLSLVATCAATLFAATQVSAAETEQTSKAMTTEGSITFYKENKPNPGPFQKNLSLAYVPGQFNFGTNKLSGVDGAKVYDQVGLSGKQYVAVSDDRESKTGWNLVANLEDFTASIPSETEGGSPEVSTLNSAELSMVLGDAQQYKINAVDSDANGIPTPSITTAGSLADINTAGFTGTTTLATPVKLVAAGGDVNIMSYGYAEGATPETTTVGIASEVNKVQLTVKDHANVKEAKYTSTVNWKLSATPTDAP